jgi:hypothetical protein
MTHRLIDSSRVTMSCQNSYFCRSSIANNSCDNITRSPFWECDNELKSEYPLELAWLKWLFLHRLKSWVRVAFLCADHSPLLHLNLRRNCLKLVDAVSSVCLFVQRFLQRNAMDA